MTGRPETPKRRTGLLALLILIATLGVNAVAYLMLRRPSEPAQPGATAAPGAPHAAAPATEDGNEGLARARRAAGIAALEAKDYDRAFSELTEALRLRKDKGDLAELLKITEDLRSREQKRAAVATAPRPPPEPTPAPAPTPAPSRRERERERERESKSKTVARAQPAPPPQPDPPAPEAQKNGLLLVTSTPPGLVVTVDGKTFDLTPTRVPLRAGNHRVVLSQGDRRVLDESVEISEDAVRTVNWESKEPPPAPKPPPEPAPTPVAAAATPPAPAPSPVGPAAATATGGAAKPAAATTGDLEVSSPSLYGEIWINGRPYGFPPLTAKGLPAGSARLELRVQGVVKKKMTVDVQAGQSTPVRVR